MINLNSTTIKHNVSRAQKLARAPFDQNKENYSGLLTSFPESFLCILSTTAFRLVFLRRDAPLAIASWTI